MSQSQLCVDFCYISMLLRGLCNALYIIVFPNQLCNALIFLCPWINNGGGGVIVIVW